MRTRMSNLWRLFASEFVTLLDVLKSDIARTIEILRTKVNIMFCLRDFWFNKSELRIFLLLWYVVVATSSHWRDTDHFLDERSSRSREIESRFVDFLELGWSSGWVLNKSSRPTHECGSDRVGFSNRIFPTHGRPTHEFAKTVRH
jgi:hypothetical protein